MAYFNTEMDISGADDIFLLDLQATPLTRQDAQPLEAGRKMNDLSVLSKEPGLQASTKTDKYCFCVNAKCLLTVMYPCGKTWLRLHNMIWHRGESRESISQEPAN